MASTITVQNLVKSARVYPEFTPVFDKSGYEDEPALTIVNDVLQRFLAEGMNWKFNRSYVGPFLTVALQQDYIGINEVNTTGGFGVANLGWIETGTRTDINSTSTPKPERPLEGVRNIRRTSQTGTPFQVSWVPINLATFGAWQPLTSYPTGLGQAQTPVSPIQQFIDANGNFLYVTVNGTSGSVQPVLAASSAAGTTVVDGSVTWTVADPTSAAIRLSPVPASSGVVWSILPVYQKKAPTLTLLSQTLAPIPDELRFLVNEGFLALLRNHAQPGSRAATEAFQKWQLALTTAVKSGDREREDACFYPGEGLTTGGEILPIGPAWPFESWGG